MMDSSVTRTIPELLESRAINSPDHTFAIEGDVEISIQTVERHVNELASGLAELGIRPGDHVPVVMGNHIDHVYTLFALAKLGAVWVPVNVNLRGVSLEWVIRKSAPRAVIADAELWKQMQAGLTGTPVESLILQGLAAGEVRGNVVDFTKVSGRATPLLSGKLSLDEIRAIIFTSGTTGPPKGALVTERMLQTFAISAGIACDVQPNDRFLLWEPIYHSAGAEMCILALREPITLVIVPRFSASRFWSQVRRYGITKMHYLGGVLDILLKSPPSSNDRDHTVKIAFGGGCARETWRPFEERFGIRIREVYGLTEGSGFTTLNASGKIGSVGRPYPYVEARIVDDAGNTVPTGQIGEIIMRGRQPGVVMMGYLNDQEATDKALRDGWLHTGDLGRCDEEGDFFYLGRRNDSIRRRGENISAWEVERVLDSHPAIQEAAVIGVKAEIGEQDLKAFVKLAPGASLDPLDLIRWCEPRMPYYQVPRYISFVERFEKTPTERIRKETLSKDTADSWDLEHSGYSLRRS